MKVLFPFHSQVFQPVEQPIGPSLIGPLWQPNIDVNLYRIEVQNPRHSPSSFCRTKVGWNVAFVEIHVVGQQVAVLVQHERKLFARGALA